MSMLRNLRAVVCLERFKTIVGQLTVVASVQDSELALNWSFWIFGFWRGRASHRTTIEPSTRQFGLPA